MTPQEQELANQYPLETRVRIKNVHDWTRGMTGKVAPSNWPNHQHAQISTIGGSLIHVRLDDPKLTNEENWNWYHPNQLEILQSPGN